MILSVYSAEELKDAIDADHGDRIIQLMDDIVYVRSRPIDGGLDHLIMTDNITLDFGGHTLTVKRGENTHLVYPSLIYYVGQGKTLTLVDAQIELNDQLSFLSENRGQVLVKSTGRTGIQGSEGGINSYNSLIHNNFGLLTIEGGCFELDYLAYKNEISQHYESQGQLIICDGCFEMRAKLTNSNTGSIEVRGGNFQTAGDFVGSNTSMAIEGGHFEIEGNFVQTNRGLLYVKEGYFEVGGAMVNDNKNTLSIQGGHYQLQGHLAKGSRDPNIVRINGGDFEIENGYALHCNPYSILNITGGSFEQKGDVPGAVIYMEGGLAELSGGTFTSAGGSPVFVIKEGAEDARILISQGYTTEPMQWQEAPSLSISPLDLSVHFRVAGESHDIQEGSPLSMVFPSDPLPPSGQIFVGWEDQRGEIVRELYSLKASCQLDARFASSQPLTSEAELKAALEAKEPVLLLEGHVTLEAYLTVDYDCLITSENGACLKRAPGNDSDPLLLIAREDEQETRVTLRNLCLDGEKRESAAPAVFVDEGTSLYLDHTTIKDNICENDQGRFGGGISGSGDIHLMAGTLIHGNSTNGVGGGLQSDGQIFLYEGCVIRDNQASRGGGLALAPWELGAPTGKYGSLVSMWGGEIINNRADQDGGGLYLENSSMTLMGGLIEGNEAGSRGGGIGGSSGYLFMTGGRVRGNRAVSGGGIGGSVNGLIKAAVYSNYASQEGDDLYYDSNLSMVLCQTVSPQPYMSWEADTGWPAFLLEDQEESLEPHGLVFPLKGWYTDGGWNDYRFSTARYEEADQDPWPLSKPLVWIGAGSPDANGYRNRSALKSIWQGSLVLYHANGSQDPPVYDPSAHTQGAWAEALSNPFLREGYQFTGWNTDPLGQGQPLAVGSVFQIDGNLDLYAQWMPVPETPEAGGQEEDPDGRGNLHIRLWVSGKGDKQDSSYEFLVSSEDPLLEGEFGDLVFEGGRAVFLMKSGQSQSLTDLPSGVSLTVTLDGYGHGSPEVNGQAGAFFATIIGSDTNQEAIFRLFYEESGPVGGVEEGPEGELPGEGGSSKEDTHPPQDDPEGGSAPVTGEGRPFLYGALASLLLAAFFFLQAWKTWPEPS